MSQLTPEFQSILDAYFKDHAVLAPDLLCPELTVYNAASLDDLWKLVCDKSGTNNAPVPYWGIVWPGGRALARYILDRPEEFAGLRVLDLGTGNGIAATAAARAGARVTAVDIDPLAVELARATARLNQVECRFVLDDPLSRGARTLEDTDMIIAGDIFYEERFATRAVRYLRDAAALGVKNVLADVRRYYFPKEDVRILHSLCVPVSCEVEGIDQRDAVIFSLRAATSRRGQ